MTELGVSLSIHANAFISSAAPSVEIAILKFSSYSHRIVANGGYDTADIVIADPEEYIASAVSMLGKHVEANAGTARAWEGFVNTIEISIGGFSLTIGPFIDIANEITVVYQEPSYSVPVPIGGEQLTLGAVSDTLSQEEFGIHSILYNLSESATSTEATQMADMLLNERKGPRLAYEVASSYSESNELSMRISCLGYYHALKLWPYTSVSITGTTDIADKLSDILDTDPNGLFDDSWAVRQIEANATVVWNYEDGTRTAFDTVAELIKFGDSSLNRWTWGVYRDRTFEYRKAETDIAYLVSAFTRPIGISLLDGSPVSKSLARPGSYAMISDMNVLVGAVPGTTDSISKIFIEAMEYTAPNELNVSTSDVSKVQQMLGHVAGLNGLV